ncbi:MAG: hypothetical protein CSB55_04820 [Candidatus Cloacimonadota bacterium]|nr:MAG: hypothetical protein CSB55_04820 [Candidatus Cloacimonadota bacterium]
MNRDKLIKNINRYRLGQNLILILRTVILIFVIFLLGFDIYFALSEITANLPEIQFHFSLAFKVGLALFILYFTVKENKKLLNLKDTARILEKTGNHKYNALLNLIELDSEDLQNPFFKERIEKQAFDFWENNSFYHNLNPIKEIIKISIAVLSANIIVFFIIPQKTSEKFNLFMLRSIPEVHHKTVIDVIPGNIEIHRNQNVNISLTDPEENTEHFMNFRYDKLWRKELMTDNRKQFKHLENSLEYFVSNEFASSDTFKITVYEKPGIKKIIAEIFFPKYTKLKPAIDSVSSGNIKVYKGSTVNWEIEANNPVKDARIFFDDQRVADLKRLSKTRFSFTEKITKTQKYMIALEDRLRMKSDPVWKSIEILEDVNPEIELISPGKDTILTKNMLTELKITAFDDFGVENLTLHYSLNLLGQRKKVIKEKFDKKLINIDYIFDLKEEFLLPGDEVEYYLTVEDNSPEHKSAQTPVYKFTLPSVREIFEKIEDKQDKQKDIMKDALEKSEKLAKDFDKKKRDIAKKDEITREDKLDIKKIADAQEEMMQNIRKQTEDFAKMTEEMQNNEVISEDIMKKMDKIRELMEEIDSDQIREALEKMEKSLETMKKEDIKKAMENFEFSLEDFRQKLKQTLDMLENIKKEQNLQKSSEMLEEMMKEQKSLLDALSENNPDKDKLNQHHDRMDQENRDLQEQMKKTEQAFEKGDEEMMKKIKEIAEKLNAEKMKQQIQQSKKSAQNGDFEKSKQIQQQMKQSMEEILKQMQKMLDQMQSGGMQQAARNIREAITRLILLSKEQRASAQSYSQDPYAILRDQLASYEGLRLTVQKLFKNPMIFMSLSPKFTQDLNFTQNSYRAMFTEINDAKKSKIPEFLKKISSGYNLMIYDLMQSNSPDSQQGSGGMQQMMQMMQQTGQQQMLMNMITEEIFKQMQKGNRLSREAGQKLRQMAEDEQRLADNLKRMLQTSPQAQKQANALQRIIDDLEGISRKLRYNQIDQKLTDTQKRILSRLLDAQKSIHKREFSKKRKGESGEDKGWETPEDIKINFEKMKRKAMESQNIRNFSPEYQKLIREYYYRLNR